MSANVLPSTLPILVAVLTLLAVRTRGVILYGTGDPDANTSEPTGELAGSGWQYQGSWFGFLGTPVAPQFFIAAKHIGGSIGQWFSWQGRFYRTTQFFDDPNNDFRLWRVCGTFPSYAPLYRNSDEAGKTLVVFGVGTQRGEPVLVNNQLRGWQWGVLDGRMRWGQNQVANLTSTTGQPPLNILRATFDMDVGPNEAHLSRGDSSGGVFIQDAGVWKLAGIAYASDGVYNTAPEGGGFEAALFNAAGLYEQNGDQWTLLPPGMLRPRPGAFYATRISSSAAWIESVISNPANTAAELMLQSAPEPGGPYADEPGATLAGENTFIAPRSVETAYYRLRNCQATHIQSIVLNGNNVAIRFAIE